MSANQRPNKSGFVAGFCLIYVPGFGIKIMQANPCGVGIESYI